MTDFYSNLSQIIVDQLLCNEIEPELADAIATDTIAVLAKTQGGQTVYLKTLVSGDVSRKHRQIYREHVKGLTVRQLARKHQMSENWVKKIIRRKGAGDHEAKD